jgi:hypothetical protein
MANVGFQVFDPCPQSPPMLTVDPTRRPASGFLKERRYSMEELVMKHMHLDIERLEQRIAPGLIGGVSVVLGGGAAAGAQGGATAGDEGSATYASQGTGSHSSHGSGSHESHGSK